MSEDPSSLPFRLIRTTRGGFKLTEGGYINAKQRRVGDVTHWQCERKGVCKARVGIKRKAHETQDGSHCIVGESLQTASDGTATKLPKLNSLKRTIQRQRERVLAAPVQPTRLDELNLLPEYQQTAKGKHFLLYDSGPDPQRILIFWTQRNLDMLQASQFWLSDGTFKTAPNHFAQVYVLHALRGGPDPLKQGHLLPSLFVLLPNKTQATYTRMKNWLYAYDCYPHSPLLLPLMYSTYFGMLSRNFLAPKRPVWLYTSKRPMSGASSQEGPIRNRCSILRCGTTTMTHPLGYPWTTNAVEAWHRSFNATVGCHHPIIWKFITALKRGARTCWSTTDKICHRS